MANKLAPAGKWLGIALAIPVLVFILRSQASAEGAISPTEAAARIKNDKTLQLVDVRTPAEYADGHLAGAKLIPVQELPRRLSEIERGRPVLLYCRTGHRSAYALKILQGHGFTEVKHIHGGMNAWMSAGLQVTK
jgi:rhodanese-related sulfurtransferase